jgi:hypothetical protein
MVWFKFGCWAVVAAGVIQHFGVTWTGAAVALVGFAVIDNWRT